MRVRALNLRAARRLAAELPARVAAVEARIVELLSRRLLVLVRKNLDGVPESYADRLTVARVKGKTPLSLVRVTPQRSKLDQLDPLRTVVYVQPRRGGEQFGVMQVLQRFSPWPVDLLPYKPLPKEGRVIYRKVSRDEVSRVRQKRVAESGRWRTALAREGVSAPAPKPPPPVRAIEDVAFTGLRLEFGSRTTRAYPHWRPALRSLRREAARWARRREILRALLDPAFQGWRRWPLRAPDVPLRGVRRYNGFVKRLSRTH